MSCPRADLREGHVDQVETAQEAAGDVVPSPPGGTHGRQQEHVLQAMKHFNYLLICSLIKYSQCYHYLKIDLTKSGNSEYNTSRSLNTEETTYLEKHIFDHNKFIKGDERKQSQQ